MKLFTEHPQSVGENYLQHMHSALAFSGRLFIAAFCCLVHGVLPFLFKSTGSAIIADLHDRMITNRKRIGSREIAGLASER
ncbi:MAG: DUF6356 family protein [Hyphomicrobiales bacterium]|nr:DUF6356 family protein [Hyphomicrobiales bacterium]